MKLFKTYIHGLLLLVVINSSCQNNSSERSNDQNKKSSKKMDLEKFYWQENINSEIGFPMEVYRGGLEAADGSYVSLHLGPDTGPWGSPGSGMTSGEKSLPNRLKVVWLSYAEEAIFEINTEIDYQKMLKLFKEGYKIKAGDGSTMPVTYKNIMVGFAPGGIAVVWIYGAGKQVEIGRYEGQKINIPQAEIDKLDSHEKLLFDASNRKRMMQNPKIVPLEIQNKNKEKPIPFGLWDSYRQKYSWRPNSVSNDDKKIDRFNLEMFNGEKEQLFDEDFLKNNYQERAVPKSVSLNWTDKNGTRYSGLVNFEEKEIFDAFNEVYKDKKSEAELIFKINILNTFLTVSLKNKEKEVTIKTNKVEIFKPLE